MDKEEIEINLKKLHCVMNNFDDRLCDDMQEVVKAVKDYIQQLETKVKELEEREKKVKYKLKKDIEQLQRTEDRTQISLLKCTKKQIDSGEWKSLSELAQEIKQDIKTKQEILNLLEGENNERD